MARDKMLVPFEEGDYVMIKLDSGEWLTGKVSAIHDGRIIHGSKGPKGPNQEQLGTVHVNCEIIAMMTPEGISPTVVKTAYEDPEGKDEKKLSLM